MANEIINISIVIPAYNEGENLKKLINNIYQTFENTNYKNEYEILIINDGSTDYTETVVMSVLKNYKNLTLINLKKNVGKAYALDSGIQDARGNIIATMDADLQYKTDDLIKMLEIINQGNDLVNGRRTARKDNSITKFFSTIYNFILRFFTRIELNDFFSGIKVFRKEIYNLMDYSGLARFIIFFSKKYNFKISEISVNHFDREKGKTAYSFIDRIILCLKDVFSLIICISLSKEGVYQIKQVVLSIYFLIFLLLIVGKFVFNNFEVDYLYYTITSFFMVSILNLIIQTFLKSKEKNNLNLMNNIKSIKKNS